jgi:peptidoglycan/LPS O-acetylase OafA/YrhL
MAKNRNLDIVRILATVMVLSCHICQYVGFDFSVGAKGVQLFFVLSGYLAFASLDRHDAVIPYYKNRLKRLLPCYWFCLAMLYGTDLLGSRNTINSFSDFLQGQCGGLFSDMYFFCSAFFLLIIGICGIIIARCGQ